jgi:hypothetical protein
VLDITEAGSQSTPPGQQFLGRQGEQIRLL